MGDDYSVETCRQLAEQFRKERILRPMRVGRYDPGQRPTYEVTGIAPARGATVSLEVEQFVGGGFAGQVYRAKVLEVEGGPVEGLTAGGRYAVKVLIPPSTFSRKFRDAIYKLGFQGSFSPQCNPAAARAGALWQKLIRRGARIRFGDERAVVDVLATFVDRLLGSCGEISEWVEGRNWQFEVDDQLDARRRWRRGPEAPARPLGSPEYRAKRTFMAEMAALLHEMGAHEPARQYEWATCKSQPNVLKRADREGDPAAGLTAVDFRPGLALLPLLPMSPGDFKLIVKGIARGSLVQFDRGDLGTLQRFIDAHAEDFADLRGALEELRAAERAYRDSLPDITHHHVRLFYSGRLWSRIIDAEVTGWQLRNVTDEAATTALRRSRFKAVVFALVGLVPILGRRIRKLWGRADLRRHHAALLGGGDYPRRAFRAHFAERLIDWHRAGRISAAEAGTMPARPQRQLPWRFAVHLMLSLLPAPLHRMLTDRRYAAEKLHFVFVRPIRLFFDPAAREQWLRDMVAEGRKKHMLSEEDAGRILSRIKEPFIQKYLKALAVHVCTLPVTQIVSVAIAAIWVLTHPDRPTAWVEGLGIIGLFQVVPVSPGSLVRGLYVLYLVIRERNFRDYNIAVFLGFFKYVGYLAFPIQMAYRYPALARFMAGHWATEAVHFVPVFGEHGALLEHGVFDLFYNRPLTIRRRMRTRTTLRSRMKARSWHVGLIAAGAIAAFALADVLCIWAWGAAPSLWNIWPLAVFLPLLAGLAVTLGAGGATLGRRVVLAAACGVTVAAASAATNVALGHLAVSAPPVGALGFLGGLTKAALWRAFLFTLLAVVGTLLTEISAPEPRRSVEQP